MKEADRVDVEILLHTPSSWLLAKLTTFVITRPPPLGFLYELVIENGVSVFTPTRPRKHIIFLAKKTTSEWPNLEKFIISPPNGASHQAHGDDELPGDFQFEDHKLSLKIRAR